MYQRARQRLLKIANGKRVPKVSSGQKKPHPIKHVSRLKLSADERRIRAKNAARHYAKMKLSDPTYRARSKESQRKFYYDKRRAAHLLGTPHYGRGKHPNTRRVFRNWGRGKQRTGPMKAKLLMRLARSIFRMNQVAFAEPISLKAFPTSSDRSNSYNPGGFLGIGL